MAETTTTLSLKLLVDTKAQRVLYAEAGKDVIDFLFSLLTIPLGAVTKLLTANCMVGSVGHLYGSVEKLDAAYVCRGDVKNALLAPAVLKLVLGEAPAKPKGLYRCRGCSCSKSCYKYFTKVSGTPCPVCKRNMTTEVRCVEPEAGAGDAQSSAPAVCADDGSIGFVRGLVTYTVMDDLSVAPMSSISAVTVLAALGIRDIGSLQEKTVEIGYKEGLAVLLASLRSKTVLTDVFIGEKRKA